MLLLGNFVDRIIFGVSWKKLRETQRGILKIKWKSLGRSKNIFYIKILLYQNIFVHRQEDNRDR